MEDGENKSSSRRYIDCKSRRAVTSIIDLIDNEFTSVVSASDLSPESQQELRAKLTETFKLIYTSNIVIQGQPFNTTTEEDTTSEYESFDAEKERYITHDLMDQLDQQMVATTQWRKSAPDCIRTRTKRLIRHQLKYLSQTTVQPREEQTGGKTGPTQTDTSERPTEGEVRPMETDTLNVGDMKDTLDMLQETVKTGHSLTQKCSNLLTTAQNLREALQVCRKSEQSAHNEMLRDTPPTSPNQTASLLTGNPEIGVKISKKLNI